MLAPRLRLWLLALTTLLFVVRPAGADYLSVTVPLDPPGVPAGWSDGTVRVEGYDGVGPAGGGLLPGQVRITFSPNFGGMGTGFPAGWMDYSSGGFQAIAFNTDLNLNASQIALPASWHAFPNLWLGDEVNGVGTSFGKYSWVLGTTTDFQNGTILISGLGQNATPAHFLFPSDTVGPPGRWGAASYSADFAGRWVWLDFNNVSGPSSSAQWFLSNVGASGSAEPPTDTPEPTTLVLGGLGLAGWCGRRMLRRCWRSRTRLAEERIVQSPSQEDVARLVQ